MTTTTHPGLPGTFPSLRLPLRSQRRRLTLAKAEQDFGSEPSWRAVAPILLFLVGLTLMRLGAAEIGTDSQPSPSPTTLEMVGD